MPRSVQEVSKESESAILNESLNRFEQSPLVASTDMHDRSASGIQARSGASISQETVSEASQQSIRALIQVSEELSPDMVDVSHN